MAFRKAEPDEGAGGPIIEATQTTRCFAAPGTSARTLTGSLARMRLAAETIIDGVRTADGGLELERLDFDVAGMIIAWNDLQQFLPSDGAS
ncbi:MAG: hypothetical protein ACLQJR_32115 [Stellaceae bacterium]